MVKAIALLTLIQLLYTYPLSANAEHGQSITNGEVASLYGRTLRSMPSSADSRSVVEGDVPDYEVVTTQYDDEAGHVNNTRPQLSITTAANASEEEECDLQQTEVNLYVWLFCLANHVISVIRMLNVHDDSAGANTSQQTLLVQQKNIMYLTWKGFIAQSTPADGYCL